MVEIQSKDVIDKISRDLKIQPALQIPREILKGIQLVYPIDPERDGLVAENVRAVTGAGALFTVPNDRHDYFLVDVTLSTTYDGTCNAVKTFIRGDLADTNEVNVELITLLYNPGTTVAGEHHLHKNFKHHVKLTPGSTVDIVNAFTLGTQSTHGSMTFFKMEQQ